MPPPIKYEQLGIDIEDACDEFLRLRGTASHSDIIEFINWKLDVRRTIIARYVNALKMNKIIVPVRQEGKRDDWMYAWKGHKDVRIIPVADAPRVVGVRMTPMEWIVEQFGRAE